MRSINDVLDKAKAVQNVRSDYKLSLTVGISESSLSTYRKGQSLPDEINCKKLASATGDDPALLVVEMQAQRAKSDEARQIWLDIASRLQKGFANVALLLLVAIASIAALALPALFSVYGIASASNGLYIMLSRWIARNYSRMALYVNLCKVAGYVPRHTHPAAVRPAG